MRIGIAAFLVVMLAASCTPVQVETNVASSTDFSAMKVFSWLETTAPPGSDVRVKNPVLAALVRAAVEKELVKKGFSKGDHGDFLVNWLGAIKSKVRTESIEHFYSGYGYQTLSGSMTGVSSASGSAVSYEEGTIVIDILDPRKHELLWRGAGTRRLLKDMDEDQLSGYVNLSVHEILDNFPPATGK